MSNPFDAVDPPQSGNPFDAVDPPQQAAAPPQGDASQWGPGMEGANAAMFGMGPTINQWMTDHLPASLVGAPVNKDQQQADAAAWEKQNPKASMAANVIGGSIPFAAAGAATGGAGFLPEMAAQAGVGAAGNSLLPISQGQDPTSAAIGGALSGAGGKMVGDLAGALVGAAGKGAAGMLKPSVNVPTGAGIQAAKTAAYDASEAAGDMASPTGLQRLRDAMTSTMSDYGYDPALQPGGQGVVSRMNAWPDAPPQGPTMAGTPVANPSAAGVTLKGLDGFRQVVNRMREGGPSGANLAGKLTGNIDDFVNNPQPGDWLGGNGAQGSQSLNDARQLAQIGFKNDAINDAFERGADNAATSGSGGNTNNTQAQAAKALKRSDQNWTPDELAALQTSIQGAPGPIRALSKLDPAGHGLGMAATLGMILSEAVPMVALGHPGAALAGAGASLTPAILGTSAKKLATAMGNSGEQALRDTVLNGGVNPNAPSAAQKLIGATTPSLKLGAGGALAATPSALQH